MARYRRRNIWWCALCVVLLAARCGSPAARTQQPAPDPAGSCSAGIAAAAGVWLSWLQMTSASTGWALRSTVTPRSTQAGVPGPRPHHGRRADLDRRHAAGRGRPAENPRRNRGAGRAVRESRLAGGDRGDAELPAAPDRGVRRRRRRPDLDRVGAASASRTCQPAQLRRRRRRLAAGELRRHDGTRPRLAVPDRRRRAALVADRGGPAVRDRPQRPVRGLRQGGAYLRRRAGRLAEQRLGFAWCWTATRPRGRPPWTKPPTPGARGRPSR